jgi:glucose/arabinose dehydrogenase
MRRFAGSALPKRAVVCLGVATSAALASAGAPSGSTARLERELASSTVPQVVARGIPAPTNVAFDGRGRMWVTSGTGIARASDGVWLVPRRGRPRQVASGLTTALGLVWSRGVLYVGHITSSSNGRVTALSGFTGAGFRERRVALDHLVVGRHTVDSLVATGTGRLFVGVGSTQDNRGRSGRVVSFDPRSGRSRLEATGLRNPYGLAWWGRRLLVTDNGRDDLGLKQPPDELNVFDPARPVARFGFPTCWDQGGDACHDSVRPLVRFSAHASSDGLAVRGDIAYVAENGSSFAANPTGNDVQCVDLRTRRRRQLWHSPVGHDPLGAVIGPDHRLYITLFRSGQVVRFQLPSRC